MQKQIVILVLLVVLSSAFYLKESGACCTKDVQYMDNTGACKAKDAKCTKVSYANEAHDNTATTDCNCGNFKCTTCASTTTCQTCTLDAFDRTKDWEKITGNDCATKSKVYCADGKKISCAGTCTTTTGSGCTQNIHKADCAEYRLKVEGTNGANYQTTPLTGDITGTPWHCVKCDNGDTLKYLEGGTCKTRHADKSQVSGGNSKCKTVVDLITDKCKVCRDNKLKYLDANAACIDRTDDSKVAVGKLCKTPVDDTTKNKCKECVDNKLQYLLAEVCTVRTDDSKVAVGKNCKVPDDDTSKNKCKECVTPLTHFLSSGVCTARDNVKSKVTGATICGTTVTDQKLDQCKECRENNKAFVNVADNFCDARVLSLEGKCTSWDTKADRCIKCGGANDYKIKYWKQAEAGNTKCVDRTTAKSKSKCTDTGYDYYTDACTECATPKENYWNGSTNACTVRTAETKNICADTKYVKTADECTECKDKAVKYLSGGKCKARTNSLATPCQVAGRSDTSDSCGYCNTPKTKYANNGVCTDRSHSKSKCKDTDLAFTKTADSCEECLAGIELEYWNGSTNKCTARVKTKNFCQSGQYAKDKDECVSGKCLFTNIARALTTCEPCTTGTSPNFTCDAGALSTVKCIATFTKQGSLCNKKDATRVATVVTDKDNEAATCNAGYQLDSGSKLCFKGYKAKTLSANKITACEENFNFAKNQLSCVRCPTNCKTCLTGCDLGCLTCRVDQIKAGTKCVCKDTYFDYGGQCVVKTSQDLASANAKYAQKLATCCPDGKYLDNAGACQACHLSCKTCTQYFITGANIATDKNKCVTHKVANCKVSTKADKCTDTCVDGYRVNTEVCEKCTPTNCKKCASSKAACTECNTGYTKATDKCYKNIANCATQVADKCTTCSDKWIKSADEKTCDACAAKCDKCTKKGECTSDKCQAGTFFKDKKCTDCPANCSACSSATNCSACKYIKKDNTFGEVQQYVNDGDTLCKKTNHIQCDTAKGEISSKISGKEVYECKAPTVNQKAHIKNCKVFRGKKVSDNTNLKCFECDANYVLKPSTYDACTPKPCPKVGAKHQYNKAGTCTDTNLFCKTFAVVDNKETDKCASCDDNNGFEWNSGTKVCYPCAANCKVCTAAKCTTCNSGYTLEGSDGYYCTKCTVANCKTCNDNHKKVCDECLPGFGTVDGVACKACPTDCLKCDYQDAAGKTLCSLCKTNYAYDAAANTCKTVANCNVLNFSKTKCQKCNAGWSPTKLGTECVKCVAGAVECGSNCAGSGLKCKSSSALIQNQTTCACLGTLTWDDTKKECLCANGTATGSKCTKCDTGYELKADACAKKAAAASGDSSGSGSGGDSSSGGGSKTTTDSSSAANVLNACFFMISLMIAALL